MIYKEVFCFILYFLLVKILNLLSMQEILASVYTFYLIILSSETFLHTPILVASKSLEKSNA